MLPEEIQKLQNLREQGALSDEEFEEAKGRLMANDRMGKSDSLMGLDLNNYRALMHASQYAGFIVPFAGLVAPIVLWAMAKDDYPEVDTEGKYILNWMISALIYSVVSGILCLFLIGIPMLIAVIFMGLIFPLLGTLKATKGESYEYPLTIKFLS
ncbi:DUF4870 domain-containing protein [filamentous cyanobacterium LEGE 11480]|uniref:DUF4870 domain-containing protein n=1 Tax=Romeriopsis navalis LEGE 11480 TaxID=2777977 RepID=A0A928Z577_9CYAN|nr:DUF4870 domain-containing protein [Romeriopsis navalis]MBE9033376.1 DUF4870 domain-containing protein [Romeriopsis navalis LEGE 11480]